MRSSGVATALEGRWSGEYKLWLGPDEPVRVSQTAATLTSAAAGGFLVITYDWSDRGQPHDGVLLARVAGEPGPMDMVWVDSFHTMGGFMRFEGRGTNDGSLEGTTKWSAGSGPDWGWRINLRAVLPDRFTVRMYIATPDGEEAPAVETVYERSG